MSDHLKEHSAQAAAAILLCQDCERDSQKAANAMREGKRPEAIKRLREVVRFASIAAQMIHELQRFDFEE